MGNSNDTKVRYILDKESEFTKKKVSEFIQTQFGTKATWQGDTIEVEKRNEIKIVEFFQRAKCNYRKAA